jgi:hypothetical protein
MPADKTSRKSVARKRRLAQATEALTELQFRPDHMIHFNGERFLGPYPDVMPAKP